MEHIIHSKRIALALDDNGEREVMLPPGAKILRFDTCDDVMCVWYMLPKPTYKDLDVPRRLKFVVDDEGFEFEEPWCYINSVISSRGHVAWHCFEYQSRF